MLKLYFKHFYFKLFNSCLYEKSLCPGILKCVYYGVVRLSLVVWSFKFSLEQRARHLLTLYRFFFFSRLWNASSSWCNRCSVHFTVRNSVTIQHSHEKRSCNTIWTATDKVYKKKSNYLFVYLFLSVYYTSLPALKPVVVWMYAFTRSFSLSHAVVSSEKGRVVTWLWSNYYK